jgi:hypothetical protein
MGLSSLSATRQTPTKKFLREGYGGSSALKKLIGEEKSKISRKLIGELIVGRENAPEKRAPMEGKVK